MVKRFLAWVIVMFIYNILSLLFSVDPVWGLIGWYLWDDLKKEGVL